MKNHRVKMAVLTALVAIGLTACGGGVNEKAASTYPEKPITVVAPSGAGGGWDQTARSLSKLLQETKLVNQTITVENKPGGGGAVFLAQYVNEDAKNNYKLFVSSPPILINHLKKEGNSPFGYKDTTPIAQLTKDYGAIAVKAGSKFNDLKSLLDEMKKDPSGITVAGGSAPGSMDHLVAILPAFKYGIDPKSIKYVSYDGGGEVMAALLGGNADVISTDASGVGQYLKSEQIKVLAVTSKERLQGDLSGVPTLKELGIDADFTIWRGLFGPKEMGKEELAFWGTTLKELSTKEEWKKELQTKGWEGEYRDTGEFASFLGEQEALLKDMLTALGMNQ